MTARPNTIIGQGNAWSGPTDCVGASLDRGGVIKAGQTIVSGTEYLDAVWLPAGAVVNSIGYMSGATAGATLTNQIFGLYDASRNLLASTVNDGATAWAANAYKSLAITGGYKVTATGLYYACIMVAATTPPNILGVVLQNVVESSTVPILCGTSDTGRTTTLSNPATAITATVNRKAAFLNG